MNRRPASAAGTTPLARTAPDFGEGRTATGGHDPRCCRSIDPSHRDRIPDSGMDNPGVRASRPHPENVGLRPTAGEKPALSGTTR